MTEGEWREFATFAGPRLDKITHWGKVALIGDASHPLSGTSMCYDLTYYHVLMAFQARLVLGRRLPWKMVGSSHGRSSLLGLLLILRATLSRSLSKSGLRTMPRCKFGLEIMRKMACV